MFSTVEEWYGKRTKGQHFLLFVMLFGDIYVYMDNGKCSFADVTEKLVRRPAENNPSFKGKGLLTFVQNGENKKYFCPGFENFPELSTGFLIRQNADSRPLACLRKSGFFFIK